MNRYFCVSACISWCMPVFLSASDHDFPAQRRAEIIETLNRYAQKKINLDTVFTQCLPEIARTKIKTLAYHDTIIKFFLHNPLLWVSATTKLAFTKPATEQEKNYLKDNGSSPILTLNQPNITCAVQYDTEIFMATTKNKILINDTTTNTITGRIRIKPLDNSSPSYNDYIVYICRPPKDTLSVDQLALGWKSGTFTLVLNYDTVLHCCHGTREPNIKNIISFIAPLDIQYPHPLWLICSKDQFQLVYPSAERPFSRIGKRHYNDIGTVTQAGFYHNAFIIKNGTTNKAFTYRLYSSFDAQKIATCDFSFAQLILMARLIDTYNAGEQPTVPSTGHAIFQQLSPELRNLLLTQKISL